jgi:lysophospholipase L1-like esterase
MNTSRRKFLSKASWAGMAAAAAPVALLANCSEEEEEAPEKTKTPTTPTVTWDDPKNKTRIVFQGDSVTQAGRSVTDDKYLWGQGYVFAISSRLMADFPQSDLLIYNRGVGGDYISSLNNRWSEDALVLRPDVLSILIGANHILSNSGDTADITNFERIYRELLTKSKTMNPNILFVLGLPFIMPVAQERKAEWDKFNAHRQQLGLVVQRVAADFDAVVVDYPVLFEAANERKPYEYWAGDGVHPSMAGHELMAREWMKQASERLSYFKKYL